MQLPVGSRFRERWRVDRKYSELFSFHNQRVACFNSKKLALQFQVYIQKKALGDRCNSNQSSIPLATCLLTLSLSTPLFAAETYREIPVRDCHETDVDSRARDSGTQRERRLVDTPWMALAQALHQGY